MAPPRLRTWARAWKTCQRCARTDFPHAGRGLCRSCYTAGVVKAWRQAQKKKRRKAKKG